MNWRPFRGRSQIAFSSMRVDTELGSVSTRDGAPETVTVCTGARQAELEQEFGDAHVHVDLWRDLRR